MIAIRRSLPILGSRNFHSSALRRGGHGHAPRRADPSKPYQVHHEHPYPNEPVFARPRKMEPFETNIILGLSIITIAGLVGFVITGEPRGEVKVFSTFAVSCANLFRYRDGQETRHWREDKSLQTEEQWSQEHFIIKECSMKQLQLTTLISQIQQAKSRLDSAKITIFSAVI